MDLETLFYLAIAALYLLSRLRKGKSKSGSARPTAAPPQRRTQPRPQPQVAQSDTSAELDEALREIRRALGWEDPQPEPQSPPPLPASETATRERAEPQVAAPREVKPRTIPPAKVERAATRTIPPSAVESATPRTVPQARLEPDTREQDPSPFDRPFRSTEVWDGVGPRVDVASGAARIREERPSEPPAKPARHRIDTLREKLSHPQSAQEAFILGEVFARRRGRH